MQSACAILSSVACRLYHIFPYYVINCTVFGKKLLNIKCVFWISLQLLSETFLTARRMQRYITINVHRSSCKVPVILDRFWWNFNFLNRFSKNTQISNFMKIRPVGDALFHTDRQTDKNNVASCRFPSFANPPYKKDWILRDNTIQFMVLCIHK